MKMALLVIDFINDIVHADGKIASSVNFIQANDTITHANKAITLARESHLLPIFIKVGFSANYLECPTHSLIFKKIKELNALQMHTWGTDFHEQLDFKSNDLLVVKHRISAFYATSLEAILRANNINTLFICGVATNMTVSSTARDAHDRDYRVMIIQDACAAATQEIHDGTIDALSRMVDIINVSDFNSFLT